MWKATFRQAKLSLPVIRRHVSYPISICHEHMRSRRLPAWTRTMMKAADVASSSSSVEESEISRQEASKYEEKIRGKQSVDFTTLHASIHELQQWVPSRVEQVIQWHQQCVALRLRNDHDMKWMYISWHPIAARVNLGGNPERGAISEAYTFGESLNRALHGLILQSATLTIPFERVVCFTFSDSLDDDKKHSLWCEVMGKYSNVILTDGNDEIRLCAQQIGSAQSSLRQLQVGSQYRAPPKQSGIPLTLEMSMEEFTSTLHQASENMSSNKDSTLAQLLVRCFQGIGPLLAQDLLSKCHLDSKFHLSACSPAQLEALLGALKSWLRQLNSHNFTPCWCKQTGRYSLVDLTSQSFDSVHELLDAYYQGIETDEGSEALTQELHSCIKKARSRMENKKKKLLISIEDSKNAKDTQKQGELIISNLHNYVPGSALMTVVDWETGKSQEIKLDSSKSAIEYAEGLFKKARKLRRTKDSVKPLLKQVEQEIDYMNEVEESLVELELSDDEEDRNALAEIKEELILGGYLKPPPDHHLSARAESKSRKARKRQTAQDPGSEGMRLYWSPNQFRILIGRNSKQNDLISKSKGKTGDYWFHAKGCPGAHVLLKLDGKGTSPEQKDLECAASLAAYYSKAREAGKVTVSMTRAENVSKPKGAPPGLVQIKKEKSLHVKPTEQLASTQKTK